MVAWEYYRLNFTECRKSSSTLVDERKLLDRFNGLGQQGWELASYYHNWQNEISGFAVFKRLLQSPGTEVSLEEMSQELVRSE